MFRIITWFLCIQHRVNIFTLQIACENVHTIICHTRLHVHTTNCLICSTLCVLSIISTVANVNSTLTCSRAIRHSTNDSLNSDRCCVCLCYCPLSNCLVTYQFPSTVTIVVINIRFRITWYYSSIGTRSTTWYSLTGGVSECWSRRWLWTIVVLASLQSSFLEHEIPWEIYRGGRAFDHCVFDQSLQLKYNLTNTWVIWVTKNMDCLIDLVVRVPLHQAWRHLKSLIERSGALCVCLPQANIDCHALVSIRK
jgi:hypothetical protein